MPAALKIGYNDIPRKSGTILSNRTANAFYPFNNLFYSGSGIYWKNAANQTSTTFEFALSSLFANQGIEYICLRGANLLFALGSGNVSIEVRGSTDGFAVSNDSLLSASGLTAANLVGPRGEDLIVIGSLSSAYSSFRVILTTANSCLHALRKIYFGKFFDFDGRSPFYPYSPNLEPQGVGFKSEGGARFKTSKGRRPWVYEFAWRNIPDSTRKEWLENIAAYFDDFPIFVYQTTDTDHNPLNSGKLLWAWAESETIADQWKDNNTTTIILREDIVG